MQRQNILLILQGILVELVLSQNLFSQDCQAVKLSDFPEKDILPKINWLDLKDTESVNYYYGIGESVDYIKARQIAFYEIENHGNNLGPLEGYSILMMIYANGFGVDRNLDLSIRMACANVKGAMAELEGRVEHLKQMKATHSKAIFDICDDISSGYMQGFCASIQSELSDISKNLTIDSLLRNWSPKDKNAFKNLRKSCQDFFDTRLLYEVDESGTGRVAMVHEESDALNTNFLDMINWSNNCSLDSFSYQDYLLADQELNNLYLKIINKKEEDWDKFPGSITKEGVKQTQRQWIKYRDSWVIFGKTKCPQISKSSWMTWLTRQRIDQLQELADF